MKSYLALALGLFLVCLLAAAWAAPFAFEFSANQGAVLGSPEDALAFEPAEQIAESGQNPTSTPQHTHTPALPETNTPLPPHTNTPQPTQTHTPPPTHTTTPTPIPTYEILRGKVLPERANCRYGPGWMYLYKYGLVGSSNLEVIGRTDRGYWVLIQAIGGNNPCWVKADLMELTGDVMSLPPVEVGVVQAWSPYYAPLTNVSARRDGDIVTVSFAPLMRRAGDETIPILYVVEAWVCQDGEFGFVPYGSNFTYIEVLDEPGCEQDSYGQALAAEKHGYTWPVEFIWP